jgi:riboflavin biosynthesis pyrimidine reductase
LSEEERRRQEILTTRAEHKRLSEMIPLGTEYSELVTVQGIDKKDHAVKVHPLSDQALKEVLMEAGAELADIGDRKKVVSNLKLLQLVAVKASRDPDICEFLMPLQSLPIALKAFELSGLTEGPKPESTSS